MQRMIYDEIHGYALTAINPFFDDSTPKDHAFVDEFSCIGTSSVSILEISVLISAILSKGGSTAKHPVTDCFVLKLFPSHSCPLS